MRTLYAGLSGDIETIVKRTEVSAADITLDISIDRGVSREDDMCRVGCELQPHPYSRSGNPERLAQH